MSRRQCGRRSRRESERGLTLIEMLVTIAVITIAVVGIAGSLAQAEKIAGVNQDQSQLEVAMRQLADYVRDSSTAGLTYKSCAQVAPLSPSYTLPTPPAGVTSWAITTINLSTAASRNGIPVLAPPPGGYCPNPSGTGTCDSTHLCDFGVQQLTLSVSNGTRSLTRTVWKSSSW